MSIGESEIDQAYHNSKPLRSDIKREDLQSVRDEHRRVSDVVKEIEYEDKRDSGYTPGQPQKRSTTRKTNLLPQWYCQRC